MIGFFVPMPPDGHATVGYVLAVVGGLTLGGSIRAVRRAWKRPPSTGEPLERAVQPLLDEGEVLQGAFLVDAGLLDQYPSNRVCVATDRRIVLFTRAMDGRIVATGSHTLPRGLQLGEELWPLTFSKRYGFQLPGARGTVTKDALPVIARLDALIGRPSNGPKPKLQALREFLQL